MRVQNQNQRVSTGYQNRHFNFPLGELTLDASAERLGRDCWVPTDPGVDRDGNGVIVFPMNASTSWLGLMACHFMTAQ